MKSIFLLAASLFLVIGTLSSIQTSAQTLTYVDIKGQLVKEWERAKVYTVQYLNIMPANKYGFKAIDSLRSFAQQMLHLASANIFLMSKANPSPTPAFYGSDIEHSPSAQNKDSVMAYVVASYDYCIAAVSSLPVASWGEVIEIFGFKETKFAMLLKTFEHQTHHRGQTTIYIRLQNIIPPNEHLF
ncbi:MAG: DinB family protein [Chitinophagales bacterium]